MQRDICSFGFTLVALLALAAPARAQSQPPPNLGAASGGVSGGRDDVPQSEEKAGTTGERAADGGFLLPFTQAPQISSGRVVVKATAGYDSALKSAVARTSAEARLLPFLALRVDFDYGPGMGPTERFGVGARFQFLRQSAHGIDGAAGIAYQPNDFRAEGHIVGSLLVGRSFGRMRILGNVLFGGDPEGDDQAGEARISALYRVLTRFHLGLDSRFRFNMSEDEKRMGTQTTDWEFQSTPTASFALGPIALLGQAGLSMLRTTHAFGSPEQESVVNAGVVAMAGMGGAF